MMLANTTFLTSAEYQSNDSNSNGSATVGTTTVRSNDRKPATAQQLIRENVQYLSVLR